MNPSLLSTCFIGLSCLMLPACAQPPADSATQTQFVGKSLRLHEHDGRCGLVSDNGNLSLLLKWPCRFHLDTQGAVRVQQVGSSHVLLVENSEAMDPPSRDCRTTLQAVRISDHGLEASPVVSQVAACPPFEWDEKVFIGLFEPGA